MRDVEDAQNDQDQRGPRSGEVGCEFVEIGGHFKLYHNALLEMRSAAAMPVGSHCAHDGDQSEGETAMQDPRSASRGLGLTVGGKVQYSSWTVPA